MAKLTNMALPKPKKGEKESNTHCCPIESEGPKYPYGLQLRLDTDTIKKLGLDVKSFKVGDVVRVQAKAKVTSLGESERQGSGESKSLEFQITDLAIERGTGSYEQGWDKAAKEKSGDDE